MNISSTENEKIKQVCKNLVGCEINIGFKIKLQNGKIYNGKIDDCNIVGNSMETILYPFLKKEISTILRGPKQHSPDFFNNDYDYELKVFLKNPGFDISNFTCYIKQLENNLEKKLFKTQYLIFEYKIIDNYIKIHDFKMLNIWNMISYNGKYPISLQNKRGIWYNIRPCSFKDMSKTYKNPSLFINKICEAISKCPNKIENKEKLIMNIKRQYEILTLKY